MHINYFLKIKYWSEFTNPYPERHKIFRDEELAVVSNEVDREDLTHLRCYAIDNSDSSDADDAISIEGNRIWIHIADVASQVKIDSDLGYLCSKESIKFVFARPNYSYAPPRSI